MIVQLKLFLLYMAVGTGKKLEIIELFLFRIRIHDLQLDPDPIIFFI